MAVSSTSSSQSTLNFDGVISGLQTGSIINAMVSMQQAPITALQNQISTDNARDGAYQQVASAVSSFQSSLQSLLVSNNVVGTSATTSTSGVLTATTTSAATPGSFQVWVNRLATATSVATGGVGNSEALGKAINDGSTDGTTLANAGFTTAPTAGTFTINGTAITINPATDTLAQVLSRINSAGAGVTASLVNDAYGRPNKIQLTSNTPGQSIQLGSASDTSNFLSAASLVASGTGTVTSANPLGTVNAGAALSSERLNLTSSLASSGSFTINGTSINWSNTDTLNSVVGRINSAGAGVQASYNPQTDQLTLTNSATGNTAMTLSDTSGNFLQAMGLVDGSGASVTQSYGQTAAYAINNQTNVQYSNSNTLSNVLPGVTLNLQSAQSSGSSPVTVTVNQNTSGADANMQSFVAAYNSLMSTLDAATQQGSGSSSTSSSSSTPAGPLAGDPSIMRLQNTVRELLTAPATGQSGAYTTLASIGISTGTPNSTATGTPTDQLTFNQTKFDNALQSNASAVYSVLSGLTGSTVLNPNSSGQPQAGTWVSSVTGTPSSQTQAGSYQLAYNGVNTVNVTFTPTNGAPQPVVSGSLLPGGTNDTVIPGVTITAPSNPPSGTSIDTLQYNIPQEGVLQNLNTYLSQVLGSGGVFDSEKTTTATAVQNLNSKITQMNKSVDTYRQTLQTEFTAMETSLASLQAQSANLISMMGSGSTSSSASGMNAATGMSSGATSSAG